MEFKKGYFITFEGADGCGKTTQIKLLNNYLINLGAKTLLTLEPGGSDLGKSLREILLHYEKPVADCAETFLYLALFFGIIVLRWQQQPPKRNGV